MYQDIPIKTDIEDCLSRLRTRYSRATIRWLSRMYQIWYHRRKTPFTYPASLLSYEIDISRKTHYNILSTLKKDGVITTKRTAEIPPKVLYNFLVEPDQMLVNHSKVQNYTFGKKRRKSSTGTKVQNYTPSIYNNRVCNSDIYESGSSNHRSLRDRFRKHFQKEKNYKFTREKVLLDFWNSQGQPLIKHKQDSKAWNKALYNLKQKLETHSPAEIKSRIKTYHKLLSESYYLKRQYEHANAIGVRVGLADFLNPSDFYRKAKYHPTLTWFIECGRPFEELSRKYLSADPSFVPYLQYFWTAELGRRPADEYQLARISEKLSKFEKLNRSRLNFVKGMAEPTKKKLTRYLFESLSDANRAITETNLFFAVEQHLQDYLEKRYYMKPVKQKTKRKRRRKLKRMDIRKEQCEEELLELDDHLEQLKNRSLPE